MWRVLQDIEPTVARDRGVVTDNHHLEALLRREMPRLLRYFRRWRNRQDGPSDLVQEVFARAYNLSGFHSTAKPEAYLQRIARDLLFERSRSDRRRAHLHVRLERPNEASALATQEDAVAFSLRLQIADGVPGFLAFTHYGSDVYAPDAGRLITTASYRVRSPPASSALCYRPTLTDYHEHSTQATASQPR